ncbi:GntR family transcriptional regulator [Corallococcus exercitus]|uniref:FadR/GntR family transcriptional regulator n=1 Tax=Corallococcus exercitus TaxID=2316736 RepID=UPI000EA1EAE7|nr:GntR family transcriptional regulator [Corallococcus exercitus]RKG74454.1 GntR family transcriptional regulator [Corallococcus exercitus]
MVRVGLVAYVEEQLERAISLGMLPRGQFGSEEKLAREFGCCRGTVREALRRLAARGLVVQRSGRKTRAVALDESLTLENLGLALHDERSEECRLLLEGFFSLKRQVLVELLIDCCASASEAQVSQLESTCYALWDAAHWEPGVRCTQLEFELLRLAAHAAARPGHLLLIQSLQRAMRGNAARLQLLMGGESLRQWAICAMHALGDRDVQALTHQLPALLKACDDQVLDRFAPVLQEHASHEAPLTEERLLDLPTPATGQGSELEARSCMEEHGLRALTPAGEKHQAFEVAPLPHAEAVPMESGSNALLSPTALSASPDEAKGGCAAGTVPGVILDDPSDCRPCRCGLSAKEDLKPEHLPAGARGPTCGVVHEEDEPPHGTPGTLTTSPVD